MNKKKNTCNWQTRLLNVKHYYTIKWEYVQTQQSLKHFVHRTHEVWMNVSRTTVKRDGVMCNAMNFELWLSLSVMLCRVICYS